MPSPHSHDLQAHFAAHYPTGTASTAEIAALYPHAYALILDTVLAPWDPNDADTLNVLCDAAVHQVAAWIETGDGNDLAGYAASTSMSLGGLTINGQPAPVSPRAVRALRAAGLLNLYGA